MIVSGDGKRDSLKNDEETGVLEKKGESTLTQSLQCKEAVKRDGFFFFFFRARFREG